MELAGDTQGGQQDFVINLQPRFYGFYDNVTQFESSYTEEQRARRLKNQQRRRVRRLLLALIAVTVSVVVMIIVYSIIATSREYYGGVPHRRNWWWSFFRRKLSESDKRPHEDTGGGSQRAIAQKDEPAGGGEDDAGLDIVGKTWLRTCDNSKQGRTYVTDERGYVCRWDQMYSGAGYGCCWESDRTNISRYSCQQCDMKTTCCLEYEFCVSCCLNPSQEQRVASWLQLNIEDSREREEMAPLSRFEQCLALCRTSSASIRRQHVFISPSHFCYAGVPS